jgi:hypothetical protein
MRGCPFSCKFCSYPAASPNWRWRKAPTILDDWSHYKDANNARVISAMDSTFTVPRPRFRKLLDGLRGRGIEWSAYARADDLNTPRDIERLQEAGCVQLSIGFESMSDRSLLAMNKRTTATDNRGATSLLSGSGIDLRASFIIGYPGETESEFAKTREFLVGEFQGKYLLNTFSLVDETLPVWQEAASYGLKALDLTHSNHSWVHNGMDSDTAEDLYAETLRAVRWGNAKAVINLWQPQFESPLLRGRSLEDNLMAEKCLERLAFADIDPPSGQSSAADRRAASLAGLRSLGVEVLQDPSGFQSP